MVKINNSLLIDFYKRFNKKETNIIAKNAITSNSLDDVSLNRDVVQSINPTFYKKIEVDTEITDQKMSGRCWIYSLLNVIRLHMIQKYDLEEDFELSQNYLLFWDKLEKANMFLHHIFDTCHCKINSRLLSILLKEPVQDGGQWNMLVNLVNKYGIIPKQQMEDTVQSNNTDKMNEFINNKLLQYANQIRKLSDKEKTNKNKIIKDMLYEIYSILVMFLGTPPKSFVWKYYSEQPPINKKKKGSKKNKKTNIKSKKYQHSTNIITPLQFYQNIVPYDVNDKVVLINAPMKSKPYYKMYNIEYFNNMVQGEKTKYVNVPIDILIESAKKSIDNNEAVWFGCDVSKYSNNEYGLFNDKVYDYKSIFGFDLELKKGENLEYMQSILNHAMIFRGYDIDSKGNISQWLVENSWGDDMGNNGYYIMSNDWFKKYVYQIIIDKKFLDKKTLDVLNKEPVLCPIWDPFGSLAIN